MDIYTIIFLALAVFIFLRLRSVLGQRTGSERPPFDRAARDFVPTRSDGKVAPISPAIRPMAPSPVVDAEPAQDRWKGIAETGTPLATGLDEIAAADSSFDAKHFVTGAKGAYEMIVLAFANGDRRTLKDLLSAEVYEGFDAAIKGREQRGEKIETRFASIDKAELVSAGVKDRIAHVTVRFVCQMISVTRDSSGAVIDGTPEKLTDVTDVWTFSRDVTSRDPNWKLVGTESGH